MENTGRRRSLPIPEMPHSADKDPTFQASPPHKSLLFTRSLQICKVDEVLLKGVLGDADHQGAMKVPEVLGTTARMEDAAAAKEDGGALWNVTVVNMAAVDQVAMKAYGAVVIDHSNSLIGSTMGLPTRQGMDLDVRLSTRWDHRAIKVDVNYVFVFCTL
jgi:hypothetical protein